MIKFSRLFAWLSFALVCSCTGHAQGCKEQQTPPYFRPLTNGDGLRYPIALGPLSWRVMGGGLQPVKGSDGLIHVAYALQVTNSWIRQVMLKSVEVVDPDKGNTPTGTNNVVTILNENVTGMLKLLSGKGEIQASAFSKVLPMAQVAVMFFDVVFPDASHVPRTLAHRFAVTTTTPSGDPATLSVLSSPVSVACSSPVVLRPPLRGSGWANGNGCCKEIGPHRAVTNSINGGLEPTEEFAIDWVKVDSEGKAFHGDPKDPKNWLCYGADIFSSSSGTVVEVVKNVPDAVPGANPEGLSLDQIGGNRVIVRMPSGGYVIYEHLVPNSPMVKVGDLVKAGQKIGLLGNSGNSDAPHLHYQVMSRPSSLDGWAVPFVFDSLRVTGRIQLSLQDYDQETQQGKPVPMATAHGPKLLGAMPLSLDVLEFQ